MVASTRAAESPDQLDMTPPRAADELASELCSVTTSSCPLPATRSGFSACHLLQRLRDEAHRWAIGAHRAKRVKAISVTLLDDIAGIGTIRKRALLSHFGSAKEVSRAGLSDLQVVGGISAAMAQKIHGHFNPRG